MSFCFWQNGGRSSSRSWRIPRRFWKSWWTWGWPWRWSWRQRRPWRYFLSFIHLYSRFFHTLRSLVVWLEIKLQTQTLLSLLNVTEGLANFSPVLFLQVAPAVATWPNSFFRRDNSCYECLVSLNLILRFAVSCFGLLFLKLFPNFAGCHKMQCETEYQTTREFFKWSVRGWMPNGPVFEYRTARLSIYELKSPLDELCIKGWDNTLK